MDFENNNFGLKIGFWNINGLSKEKSENDIYQEHINKFDIIFLSETCKSESSIHDLQHPRDIFMKTVVGKLQIGKGGHQGGF